MLVSDFPTEAIERIFVNGCEIEAGVHPQDYEIKNSINLFPWRLKLFAQEARIVCSRWKGIIDSKNSSSFSLGHFWISRLSFILDSLAARNEEQSRTQKLPFIKQMMTFRSQLAASQGCDLAIT